MTEQVTTAATTDATSANQAPAADQTAANAAAADATATAPADTTAAPATKPTEGEQQQDGEAKGDEAAKTGEEQAVEYDLSLPDGFDLQPEVGDALKSFLSTHKLPAEAAKELTALGVQMEQAKAEAYQKTRDGWVESIKSDQEIGGDGLDANVGLAKRALDTFGTPELKSLLEGSGFGDHPEIVRAFYRVGKAISDDKLVTQQGSGPAAQAKSQAQQMFPSMANP